jgi:hypothetical protein
MVAKNNKQFNINTLPHIHHMKNMEYISKHRIIRERKHTHTSMSGEKRAKERCTRTWEVQLTGMLCHTAWEKGTKILEETATSTEK